ncbi:hypothetical protein BN128_2802 [Cronobacter sakazakii 696]|nr:hypothetical protein BN128_2802 [Cronobacter sakazakii 696]
MAIKGKWLYFSVINDAAKISMHADFEVSTFRPVIVTVTIITSSDYGRVVSYRL